MLINGTLWLSTFLLGWHYLLDVIAGLLFVLLVSSFLYLYESLKVR
ncbi:phosphatase PAP2 family protein [Piscirickettsia litoralis]